MPKQVKLGLIFSVLALLAIVSFSIYKAENNKSSFIKETNPNLSLEEIEKIEKRLVNLDVEIQANSPGSDIVELYMDKGDYLHQIGKLNSAKEAYSKALSIDPNKSAVYSRLYKLQIDMKDLKGAEKSIEKYLSFNKDSYSRWEQYIDFHKNVLKKTNEEIRVLYLKALKDTDNNKNVIVNFAKFFELDLKNVQAAKDYWVLAIAEDPENKATYDVEVARLNTLLAVPPTQ